MKSELHNAWTEVTVMRNKHVQAHREAVQSEF